MLYFKVRKPWPIVLTLYSAPRPLAEQEVPEFEPIATIDVKHAILLTTPNAPREFQLKLPNRVSLSNKRS